MFLDVREAPDRPGRELVFITQRPYRIGHRIALELPVTYGFARTQRVSVPEQALEHWASLWG
jgi:hypothetical protein